MTALHALVGGQIPAEFFATRRTLHGWTPATVRLAQGRIAAVDGEVAGEVVSAGAVLDAGGCFVLPGFIDLHIHGAAGHDLMDATPAALWGMARFLAQHGVTAFLPTTMTAPHTEILAALHAVAAVMNPPVLDAATGDASDVDASDVDAADVDAADVDATGDMKTPGARILGVHLEGPYLSPAYPGAQSATAVRPPDPEEFNAYLATGVVRLVTLAPEQPGAGALIAAAHARQVAVAAGHSAATYAQAQAAFDRGVNQTTHMYNAMPGLHHREPGILGAALVDDRVFAQLIADGIHVHPAAMSILARCKQPARTILITDAMRAAGLGPGRYDLGGVPVIVEDGACRLESGVLAGSVLTMDAALRNFIAATGLSLAQAWVSAGRTAAQALGLGGEYGALAPGYAADLVVLDADLQVVATVIAGRLAYLREPERLAARQSA